MACLCRITQTRVSRLISQFKMSIYRVSAPSLPDYPSQNTVPSNLNRQQILGSYNDFSVRFFAAPVHSKKNKEETNKSKGPRLNEQIKSHMVRLVTDEGHEIVPFHVALDRAKSLNFDLVEVNCNAKPIVCKIMDYHRDKYQQQLKVKERSKHKAQSSVRKGSCKEVRISLKIEQKDLEMKAAMAKRLMEHGYRVKCMVQAPSMSEDDPKARAVMEQKLKGLIDRLHTLIEEVAFVESGPRVEKSQAFVLVRHMKFGPSKKGGKKAAKSAESPTSPVQHPANVDLEMSSQHSGLGSDNEDSFSDDSEEEVFDLGDQEKETVSPIVDSYSPAMTRPSANSSENRYSKQKLTRVEAEGDMRPVDESEALNLAGPVENRYSSRPPGPAHHPPQPGFGNTKGRSFSGDTDATVAPENQYCRQHVSRTEGERYMRPVRDKAQLTQSPNFTGLSVNRYSRRPPPPPFREKDPTTDSIVPPGLFNDLSTNLPQNQPPMNNGNIPKNANAKPSGFTKPPSSSTRLPHNLPPTNGSNSLFGKMQASPGSPSTECTTTLSGLINADRLRNANSTGVFGSMEMQGLPSARPNPGSPLTYKTEMFLGLLGSDGLTSANATPFGFKKTLVPPNVRPHPDSPETDNMDPYSGLFDRHHINRR